MRVLGNLSVPRDIDSKYPFGSGIKNENDTEDGTPVSEEIYGDVLYNLYKIVKDAKIIPSNVQDNDNSGYQLVDAFKKMANTMNDIEQVLTLNNFIWKVPFDLSILPDKYVFFSKATDSYVSGVVYTFEGIDNTISYPFDSPTGFNSNDEIIVVIDQSTVRAYSLTLLNRINETFTVFGTPLSYNESNYMYYHESSHILSDNPMSDNIENRLRVFSGNGTLILNDLWIMQGNIIAIVYDESNITYRGYEIDLLDFSNISEITFYQQNSDEGFFPEGINRNPYFYCDGMCIYVTNNNGLSDSDNSISKYLYEKSMSSARKVAIFNLDPSFIKTTNLVVKNDFFISFVNGNLKRFSLTSETYEDLGYYNSNLGVIFNFNNNIYFTSGEVATKWNL